MTNNVNTSSITEKLKDKVANKTATQSKSLSINDLLQKMLPQIKNALGNVMTPERFARIALSTYNSNPAFASCTQQSFLSALMMSAQSGLEPNTVLGEAFMIPYGGKVNFQIGYKGILSLAYRSGQFKSIYSHEVYPNDEFRYSYGLNKDLIHVPADAPNGEPIFYYAVYHLQNGGYDFQVWSREKVMRHATQYSKTFSKGPWTTNFDEMAKKTVLISTLKLAPKSVEIAKALSYDNTVKEDIKEDMSKVENVLDDVKYEIEPDNNDAAADTTIDGPAESN